METGGRGQLNDSNVAIVRSRYTVGSVSINGGYVNFLFVTFVRSDIMFTKANLCSKQ